MHLCAAKVAAYENHFTSQPINKQPSVLIQPIRYTLCDFNKRYSAVGTKTQHFKVERVKAAFENSHQRERGHTKDRGENVSSLQGFQKTEQ